MVGVGGAVSVRWWGVKCECGPRPHIYLPSLASPLSKPLELHITHLAHGGGRTVGDVIVEVVSHAACARGKKRNLSRVRDVLVQGFKSSTLDATLSRRDSCH